MPQVTISDDLFRAVAESTSDTLTADQFVADAVREKLAWQARKREFFRLSDATRQTMMERGVTEEEILDDFETFRNANQ
jgi:hypothetical protein